MVKNFLGNCRVENYKALIEELLKSLQNIGTYMSIKVHFLHSHLDKFADNYCNVSQTRGARNGKEAIVKKKGVLYILKYRCFFVGKKRVYE